MFLQVSMPSAAINSVYSNSQQSHNSGSCPTSSMETVPTDLVDGSFSGEESDEESWGRLFPVGSSFESFDLVREEYTFGRGENCDYIFQSAAMRKHPCFPAYSKVHFKIKRENTSTGWHVFLTDTSSNGTFINGEKVGKHNKQVINNNDEISLALKANKAFVFMDNNAKEDENLPQQLREKYTLSKLLGRGACGEVKLAFEKGSCRKFAVKIVEKKKFSIGGKLSLNSQEQVMREVKILKALKHPCVIQIEDVIDTPDCLYIVLELVAGGELFDRIISLEKLDEPIAKLIFYQMAVAVQYLHDQGITHRDLKPENILLGSEETTETIVKVTDFGLSKFVDPQTMMKTFCGTPNYLAPEVLLSAGKGEYTKSIDCWSLGVILFICLVGYPPFSEDRTDMKLDKQILGGHCNMIDSYWSDINPEATDLVKKLLVVDPEDRITIQEVLNHPWLKDEEMRQKAHKLMYPESDGMVPPSVVPKKRRSQESGGEESPEKKKFVK